MSHDHDNKSNNNKTDWGEEVMPGVYMMRREGAPNPFAHPALQAMESFDLKQIYDKVDECEDLIQKLLSSNAELLKFFLPKEEQNEDSEEDEENEEEEEEQQEEQHVDPNNNNQQQQNNGAGDVNSMEALLAMAEAEAEKYLNGDDDDGNGNRRRKNNKSNNYYDETTPPPKELLAKLPSDISEAILENLDIIRDQRKQQKELLEFSAVRQHKCSHHRVHGTAANSTENIVEPPTTADS